MRLAVFGMGNMGRAFAARALERGHQVTVWNRTANRAADLISGGALETHSPKEAVAGSDVVLMVLADDNAVLSVCLGEHGVLNSLPAGATLANC
jgi:3-hydroxyisobutyrate dehydrogenase-like beta-hydroxyacid dehydrogenase